MKKINFKPEGICCKEIILELSDENIITDVDFIGGCPGNLIGLKSLVVGQNAIDISSKLKVFIVELNLLLAQTNYQRQYLKISYKNIPKV